MATQTSVGVSTWQIDPMHSTAEFAVRHMMVATVRGHISGVAGTIRFDEEEPTRSVVEATLDASTIDTREPQRDGHLRSADFLDVELVEVRLAVEVHTAQRVSRVSALGSQKESFELNV